MPTLLKDLVDIPERVHQGDFVLKLAEGVDHLGETLTNYVLTDQLEASFESALSLVESALAGKRSKAALLDGSFGSGKSHFMAVLYGTLRHDPASRTKLGRLVAKHDRWLTGKKLLLLPLHFIDTKSVESAIFAAYVTHMRAAHPDAQIPALYLADKLLDNADAVRKSLGDAKFFEVLGAATTKKDGWGEIVASWDAVSYDAARKADHASPDRQRLVSALLGSTLFGSYQDLVHSAGEGFVDLDTGLSLLSRHASSLGYDGVVLFLDELILWLSSHVADLGFVHREGAKLVKLVEAASAHRPAPIVSFVARQRDLKELVGEHVPGAEKLSFSDALKHMSGRFDRIPLEDRNLPAIVNKRLLAPKNADAGRELTRTVDSLIAGLKDEVKDVLLGKDGKADTFRQVAPFSPALVDTLVAVSSLLQRERTALKLLLQLLANGRETLTPAEVVPVGDLFDVLATGDEPFAQEVKAVFDEAKKLYHQKLLPALEVELKITAAVARSASTPAAAAFRAMDRMVKTLLLAALAPDVEALRDLTAARLVALNHGQVRTPIPGNEVSDVVRRLRSLAAAVGALRIEDGPNPRVTVQITGVDVEEILETAMSEDNPGNRQGRLRSLLFSRLGIEEDVTGLSRVKHSYRGTKRDIAVVFGNVRELSRDMFRNREADEWTVILDYPFDDGTATPADDRARLAQLRKENESTRTLVWLPAFFTHKSRADLGRLVKVEFLLKGDRLRLYASRLSEVERNAARAELESLKSRLVERLGIDLEMAYGVRTDPDAQRVEAGELGVESLEPSFLPRLPVGENLRKAFEGLLTQALEHRYPEHPRFEEDIRPAVLKDVSEAVREAAQETTGSWEVLDKQRRDRLRRVAMPLRLGNMGESRLVLDTYWKERFQPTFARDPEPKVADLRKVFDEPRAMGLPRDVQNLVLLLLAEQTGRSFRLNKGPYEAKLDDLPDELTLAQAALPDAADWDRAVRNAEELFGFKLTYRARTASALTELQRRVAESATAEAIATARRLEDAVADAWSHVGGGEADPPRLETIRAGRALLEKLSRERPENLAGLLARATFPVSAIETGQALKTSKVVADALTATKWRAFETAVALPEEKGEEGRRLVTELKAVLAMNEIGVSGGLAPKLRAFEDRALDLPRPSPKAAAAVAVEQAPESRSARATVPESTLVEEGTLEVVSSESLGALTERLGSLAAKEPLRLVWRLERKA